MNTGRLRKAVVFKSAVVLATLCLFSVLASMIGTALTWKLMRKENHGQIQQSLGDASSFLAAQVRMELERLIQNMMEAGATRDSSATEHLFPELTGERDLLDFSVWKQEEGTDRPVRALLMTNRRFLSDEQEQLLRSSGFQERVAKVVQPVFQGQTVVLPVGKIDGVPSALLAVPVGSGKVKEVITAHFRLERLVRAFKNGGAVRSILITPEGTVLAQPEIAGFRGIESQIENLPEDIRSSPQMSGFFQWKTPQGKDFLGAYRRLSVGRLAVISQVPIEEAGPGLGVILFHTGLFTVFYVLLCAGVFLVASGQKHFFYSKPLDPAEDESDPMGKKVDAPSIEPALSQMQAPSRRSIVVMHGLVWKDEQVFESSTPEETVETLNLFFQISETICRRFDGIFEGRGGSSFTAYWGGRASRENDLDTAIRCALELRREFFRLNASRKLDGLKPLPIALGVDTGIALAGRLGPSDQASFTVTGDVVTCSRTLAYLAIPSGTDILVSADFWSQVSQRFVGEQQGEAQLSASRGLTGYVVVAGYVDENGEAVIVEPAVDFSALGDLGKRGERVGADLHLVFPKRKRDEWMINNGSHIIGPLSSKEIAERLYAQELDFDCECWVDGAGFRKQIRDCGVFTGSDEVGARFWVYDGETIHGPVSEGFIRTAIAHGALGEKAHVCEESTIRGWKPVADWLKSVTELSSPSTSSEPTPAASGTADSCPASASGTPKRVA